ncbi:MAG: hypothetical protein V4438_03125 [Patescibacteria group bacterium]
MKKSILAIILVLIVCAVAAGAAYFVGSVPTEEVVQNNCGFAVTSITPNQKVAFPLTITGIIDNSDQSKCTWQMFEGQAGSAAVYVDKNGWQKVGDSVPTKVDDWMSPKTNFSASFDNISGLADGDKIKIVFTEEDAAGKGNPDTYELPLMYGNASIARQTYKNDEYGFQLEFSDSWKGFSVYTGSWEGRLIDGNTQYTGPLLIFRNPNTTATEVWQNIPIMVFTHEVWNLVVQEKVAVSAAPIGPAKIGENSKYVFATPPRWYGFTDAKGFEEAVNIVKTFRVY